ncbi:hypothetical protein RFI_40372 [Reticulomyxa filosa]|uniref:Uncharacterized protein n=1 Tax=Reticulomyxa filosa TaxID=46433 RepID=X6L8T7_RETFI|nr:hypothetical protein RFI_40372 [Reticulomyxa filosa]|eukprot:ETN97159.1 hypothetical protein RFI_40372 [Reticulomyxa filosa]
MECFFLFLSDLELITNTTENFDKQSSEARHCLDQSRKQADIIQKGVTSIGETAAKLKEEIKSLEQEVDEIADLSNKNAIDECLEDAKDKIAKLEARQSAALLKSEAVLTSIEVQDYELSELEAKTKAQEENVDKAANSAKERMDAVTKMQQEQEYCPGCPGCPGLFLYVSKSSSFGWILKKTWTNTNKTQKKVENEVLKQMKNLGNEFKNARGIKKLLRDTRSNLKSHKMSLNESANAVDNLIDKLLTIKA